MWNNWSGEIQLVLGPMCSGKTREMLKRIHRYTLGGLRCLVVKHSKDKRYHETKVVSHDQESAHACPMTSLVGLLAPEKLATFDVVGIDEGQFFLTPDADADDQRDSAEVVKRELQAIDALANAGKIVVIAALDATSERLPFGAIGHLVAIAEKVDKLNAVCNHCKRTAYYSHRIDKSNGQTVMVGGPDNRSS